MVTAVPAAIRTEDIPNETNALPVRQCTLFMTYRDITRMQDEVLLTACEQIKY
jgi:hypothetical protein